MRLLSILWWLFAVVVAYGSIYPFDFQASPFDRQQLSAFIASCCGRPGRGDVLGNILLFMPYGFLGLASGRERTAVSLRFAYVVVLGTFIALALQIAQIYLPSRDQNLQDVLWNVIGIVAGAGAGILARGHLATNHRSQAPALLPLLLIGSWLMYRLLPFVPSLDLQQLKNSVKPLLLHPEFSVIAIAHDAVAWLVIASAMRRMQSPVLRVDWLPLAILAVLALEVLIVDNTVSASNLAGAVIALVAWYAGFRLLRAEAVTLAALLVVVIVAQGLAPVAGAPMPDSFSWLPFRGLLGGSMYLNVQAICEKVFLYGSLIYFLGQARLGTLVSTMAVGIVVTALEVVQQFIPGHTAEITDPILVVLAAVTVAALSGGSIAAEPVPAIAHSRKRPGKKTRHVRHRRQRTGNHDTPTESSSADSATTTGDWVDRPVNLRADQVAFLSDRAHQLHCDLSTVIQQLITDHAETNPSAHKAPQLRTSMRFTPWRLRPRQDRADKIKKKWVRQTIRLGRHQADHAYRLAASQDLSFSRVIRRIVANAMDAS